MQSLVEAMSLIASFDPELYSIYCLKVSLGALVIACAIGFPWVRGLQSASLRGSGSGRDIKRTDGLAARGRWAWGLLVVITPRPAGLDGAVVLTDGSHRAVRIDYPHHRRPNPSDAGSTRASLSRSVSLTSGVQTQGHSDLSNRKP